MTFNQAAPRVLGLFGVASLMILVGCSAPSDEPLEQAGSPSSDVPICKPLEGNGCFEWKPDASQHCRESELTATSRLGIVSLDKFTSDEQCFHEILFAPYQGIPPERFSGALDESTIANANRLEKAGWSSPQETPIQIFFASDIPAPVRQASQAGLRAAESILGSYGPLKVFVIGNDLEAAEPLADAFCEWAYDAEHQDHCRDDQGKGIREMATVYPGGNGFAQHSWHLSNPTQSFVHNPLADDENRFAGMFYSEELLVDKMVSAHEYFHIFQEAHLIYRAEEPGLGEFPGVRWFNEGSARYFEMFVSEIEGWADDPRRTIFQQFIEEGAAGKERWPAISLRDIETEENLERLYRYCAEPCIGHLQYNVGGLAVAYLAKISSDNLVIHDFWSANKEVGFYEAFEETFGLSLDSFYSEFNSFYALADEEQLEFLLE
tara:strand:+ start:454 stop:1758 length:1305 start_codon:yes stop_codon:yes gene_type:complete